MTLDKARMAERQTEMLTEQNRILRDEVSKFKIQNRFNDFNRDFNNKNQSQPQEKKIVQNAENINHIENVQLIKKFKNKISKQEIFVIEDQRIPLLGKPALKALGIVMIANVCNIQNDLNKD